ncbi:hypothetical protein GCM10020295_77430 [Streptomyces cinereospinus]
MTDDAYLFLLDDASAPLGVAPAAVGGLACLETPRGPRVAGRPRDHGGLPAPAPAAAGGDGGRARGAERLPVPLSDEELNRVRHRLAPEPLARIEEDLLAYRDCADGRDNLIGRALAAGVPPHRVVELTGVDPATVTAAAGR